ncbi:MAG: glycosyltransferase family 2 protein [Bacteroidales bacterium]|nr:glycosyltransferase family 2 protein [Bacteroidales bacterium]
MRTAVVILNWNTREYLRKFLPALLKSVAGMGEVVVADSASTDGSMEMLAAEFPSVRRIPLDANYGFTGGYNRALAQLDSEYFILINSDIEVTEGWLAPLVEWMDSHPDCGACGPKLLSYYDHRSFEYAGAAGGFLDRYGYPFCRGRVLKRVCEDRGQYDNPCNVAWVSGACLMTRSSLWKEMGGLDDRFFAHQEEIDYCWRLQLAGFDVSVVPQSVVYHLGGGTLPQDSPWKLELNYRNNLLLLENNLAATIGSGPARRRIAFRKLLDFGSALVYLLTLKPSYAAAVFKGHAGYRKLRSQGRKSPVTRDKRTAALTAYDRFLLIPTAALKGKGIFDYLDHYENSN